jgi:hypothetical protein
VLIGITRYHTAIAMANEPPISHRDPVSELRRTCLACPSQWGGKIDERGSIYIRYRWGLLRVWMSGEAEAWRTGRPVFKQQIGALGTGLWETRR